MNALYYFAAMYALQRPVASNVRLPKVPVIDMTEFSQLCAKRALLDLYLWLSFRFPKIFIERDLSMRQRAHSLSLIEQSLQVSAKAFGTSLDMAYMETKKMFITHNPDGLPPVEWHDVRESTKKYLKDIPAEKQYCFPHGSKPGGRQMSDYFALKKVHRARR